MKIKRKGKKVHPSPTPLSMAASTAHNSLSVLNLLPAAILTLITSLTLQDQQVLAYMITRSLKTTTTTTSNHPFYSSSSSSVFNIDFDCECFECYTSFWCRWDLSPNRELIHQAIEAFEEHLANVELEKKLSYNRKITKKDKKVAKKIVEEASNLVVENGSVEVVEKEVKTKSFEDEVVVAKAAEGHKGFARKVLLNLLGVFNLRLWNLWGPNV